MSQWVGHQPPNHTHTTHTTFHPQNKRPKRTYTYRKDEIVEHAEGARGGALLPGGEEPHQEHRLEGLAVQAVRHALLAEAVGGWMEVGLGVWGALVNGWSIESL